MGLRHPSKEAFLTATKVVLGTRLVLVAIAVAAAWLMANTQGVSDQGIFALFDRWDGPLFARVAEFGYTDPNTDPHATAFFPLLPLLLKSLHAIGFSYVVAGMLISSIASIVAGAFLYQLAEDEMGEGSGRRALLYMLLFPTAVFLVAPYSEALFLAGAIAAFYYRARADGCGWRSPVRLRLEPALRACSCCSVSCSSSSDRVTSRCAASPVPQPV